MSFLSYSQHYKLYSNVWALNCEEGGEHMFIPKEGGDKYGGFGFGPNPFLTIDENKVYSYLLESLNEFRNDYGKGPIKGSKYLNDISQKYCKKMITLHNKTGDYPHDNLSQYGLGDMAENVACPLWFWFRHLNSETQNVEKLVAESYFDFFVHSPSHMKMLLSDAKWFGFGLIFDNDRMYIVIKSSSNPKVK